MECFKFKQVLWLGILLGSLLLALPTSLNAQRSSEAPRYHHPSTGNTQLAHRRGHYHRHGWRRGWYGWGYYGPRPYYGPRRYYGAYWGRRIYYRPGCYKRCKYNRWGRVIYCKRRCY